MAKQTNIKFNAYLGIKTKLIGLIIAVSVLALLCLLIYL